MDAHTSVYTTSAPPTAPTSSLTVSGAPDPLRQEATSVGSGCRSLGATSVQLTPVIEQPTMSEVATLLRASPT